MMRPGVVGLVLAAVALGGCSGVEDVPAEQARETRPTPRLGGRPVVPAEPPSTPMGRLERVVAERLAARLRPDRVSVDHLDCPPWTSREKQVLTCTGYFDGVVGKVRVRLDALSHGAVDFTARVTEGVIATQSLVERLESEGYERVDCGDRATYPAEVGAHLVCAVTDGERRRHLVATVTDRTGAVQIADF